MIRRILKRKEKPNEKNIVTPPDAKAQNAGLDNTPDLQDPAFETAVQTLQKIRIKRNAKTRAQNEKSS